MIGGASSTARRGEKRRDAATSSGAMPTQDQDARTPRVPARALGGAAPFYLVVVDATWPLARKMARHLDRLLDGGLPHAKLETDLVSVYARTQSKTGRVCTVPARRPTVAATGEVPFRAGRGHRPLRFQRRLGCCT